MTTFCKILEIIPYANTSEILSPVVDKRLSLNEALINSRSNNSLQDSSTSQLLHNFVVSQLLKFLTDEHQFIYVNKLKSDPE